MNENCAIKVFISVPLNATNQDGIVFVRGTMDHLYSLNGVLQQRPEPRFHQFFVLCAPRAHCHFNSLVTGDWLNNVHRSLKIYLLDLTQFVKSSLLFLCLLILRPIISVASFDHWCGTSSHFPRR